MLEADSAVITGKITALNGDDTLMISTIKLGCIAQQTNSGVYQLKVKPFNAKSHLTTTSIGYLTIETEPFVTHPGDSVVVIFFLAQDERPLINCEGYQ